MAVLHGHAGRFRRFWPRAVAVVKILVAAGVNVNSRGMQGVTPLYSAITYKHLDIARCRLGARVEAQACTPGNERRNLWAALAAPRGATA